MSELPTIGSVAANISANTSLRSSSSRSSLEAARRHVEDKLWFLREGRTSEEFDELINEQVRQSQLGDVPVYDTTFEDLVKRVKQKAARFKSTLKKLTMKGR